MVSEALCLRSGRLDGDATQLIPDHVVEGIVGVVSQLVIEVSQQLLDGFNGGVCQSAFVDVGFGEGHGELGAYGVGRKAPGGAGGSEVGLESVAALGHGQLQSAHFPAIALCRCPYLTFVGDVDQDSFRFNVPLVVTALTCCEMNGGEGFAVAKVFQELLLGHGVVSAYKKDNTITVPQWQ